MSVKSLFRLNVRGCGFSQFVFRGLSFSRYSFCGSIFSCTMANLDLFMRRSLMEVSFALNKKKRFDNKINFDKWAVLKMQNSMDCSFANREEFFIGSKNNNIVSMYSAGFIFNETITNVIRRSSKDVFFRFNLRRN